MDSLFASPVTLGLLVVNVIASLIAFRNEAFMQQNILWVGPMRERGEWYRGISSGFLDVNQLHLFLNIYGLWLFGPFAILLAFFVIPMWGIVFGVLYVAISYAFSMRQNRIIGHEAHLGGAVAGVIATLLVRPETFSEFVAQAAARFG